MALTTPDLVKGILGKNYTAGVDLVPFIDASASIANRIDICAEGKNVVMTGEDLELIERWLAAHFYMISDRGKKKKRTERASADYDGLTEKYLESTLYGQQVIVLDKSHCVINYFPPSASTSSAIPRTVVRGFYLGS